VFFDSRRNSSAKPRAPTGTTTRSAPRRSDDFFRLDATLTVKEMAKIKSATSRAMAKTSTPVRKVFLFRFLRATEKKEI